MTATLPTHAVRSLNGVLHLPGHGRATRCGTSVDVDRWTAVPLPRPTDSRCTRCWPVST